MSHRSSGSRRRCGSPNIRRDHGAAGTAALHLAPVRKQLLPHHPERRRDRRIRHHGRCAGQSPRHDESFHDKQSATRLRDCLSAAGNGITGRPPESGGPWRRRRSAPAEPIAAAVNGSISAMVSSPIPSERRVERLQRTEERPLAAIVRSMRSSSARQCPRYARRIVQQFADDRQRSTRSVPLMTMASVAPCVKPCSAVSSWPIMCVAQSCVTPIRIMSFRPASPKACIPTSCRNRARPPALWERFRPPYAGCLRPSGPSAATDGA